MAFVFSDVAGEFFRRKHGIHFNPEVRLSGERVHSDFSLAYAELIVQYKMSDTEGRQKDSQASKGTLFVDK